MMLTNKEWWHLRGALLTEIGETEIAIQKGVAPNGTPGKDLVPYLEELKVLNHKLSEYVDAFQW